MKSFLIKKAFRAETRQVISYHSENKPLPYFKLPTLSQSNVTSYFAHHLENVLLPAIKFFRGQLRQNLRLFLRVATRGASYSIISSHCEAYGWVNNVRPSAKLNKRLQVSSKIGKLFLGTIRNIPPPLGNLSSKNSTSRKLASFSSGGRFCCGNSLVKLPDSIF